MKYILCQPAQPRFQWELDVVLTNIYSLDKEAEICLLFAYLGEAISDAVIEHIKNKYPKAEVHSYLDFRDDKRYVPSIRPYLWHQYLSEDKTREKETYFYIDSDVIFRELPDFDKLGEDANTWVASDCGGYIDYDYIFSRENGDKIIEYCATLTNLTKDELKSIPGAGAQWFITNPTAEMWLKIYEDSNKIWQFFSELDSNIQKWTAEMWAQLYNTVAFGRRVVISPELDFCRPTDNVKMWDAVKIFHNAGVTAEGADHMFFKGKYTTLSPFDDDLSFVRRDKASIKYVEAIKAVMV